MTKENDQWKITITKGARKELVKVIRGKYKYKNKYCEILTIPHVGLCY